MDNDERHNSGDPGEPEGEQSDRAYSSSASSDGRLRLFNELTRIQLMNQKQQQNQEKKSAQRGDS